MSKDKTLKTIEIDGASVSVVKTEAGIFSLVVKRESAEIVINLGGINSMIEFIDTGLAGVGRREWTERSRARLEAQGFYDDKPKKGPDLFG